MRELNYFELEQIGYENNIKNKPIEEMCTYSLSFSNPCKHKTGWYGNVETFWSRIFETDGIRVYCCSDCGDILQGKEIKKWQDNRANK